MSIAATYAYFLKRCYPPMTWLERFAWGMEQALIAEGVRLGLVERRPMCHEGCCTFLVWRGGS